MYMHTMTDTEILDSLLAQMRSYAVTSVPLPPARIQQWINKAYEQRECVRREGDAENYQHFWRCQHHPAAIPNWFNGCWRCEHGCEVTELRWCDNGTRKPQTSSNQSGLRK